MRENGVYEIQPTLSYDPFEVQCTFDKDEVETSLKRNHQHWPTYTATPGGSDGCDEPGCFTDKITYAANADQLEVRQSTKESSLTIFRLWFKSHTDVSKESSRIVHQMH